MKLKSITVEGSKGWASITAPSASLKAHSMSSKSCSACGDLDGYHMPARFGTLGDCFHVQFSDGQFTRITPTEDLGVAASRICLRIGYDHGDDAQALEVLLDTMKETCDV